MFVNGLIYEFCCGWYIVDIGLIIIKQKHKNIIGGNANIIDSSATIIDSSTNIVNDCASIDDFINDIIITHTNIYHLPKSMV